MRNATRWIISTILRREDQYVERTLEACQLKLEKALLQLRIRELENENRRLQKINNALLNPRRRRTTHDCF